MHGVAFGQGGGADATDHGRIVAAGDGDVCRLADAESSWVCDLVAHFNQAGHTESQVVKGGVRGVYAQGVAGEAKACGQVGAGVGGGHTRDFVGKGLDGKACCAACVHVAGALQQVEGVQGGAFQRARIEGGVDDRGFVDVQDRDVDLFFCAKRGVCAHIGGHDGEAVTVLGFEVGAVLERDGAGDGVNVEQGNVTHARFEAVGHRAIGRNEVCVCGCCLENGGADGGVFGHGAGGATDEQRGAVIAVDRDQERAGSRRLGVQGHVGLFGSDTVNAISQSGAGVVKGPDPQVVGSGGAQADAVEEHFDAGQVQGSA